MIIHRALPARPDAPRAPRPLPHQRRLVPWARWGFMLLLALVAVSTVSYIGGCQARACSSSTQSAHTREPGASASNIENIPFDAFGAPFLHVCHHPICHAITLPLAALLSGLAVVALLQISITFARHAARGQPLAPPPQRGCC